MFDDWKWQRRIWRLKMTLYWACASGAGLAVVLWLVAATSGCTVGDVRREERIPAMCTRKDLSVEISQIAAKMTRAGTWPDGVSVSFTNATNYSVSVTGKYYPALDTNNVREVVK